MLGWRHALDGRMAALGLSDAAWPPLVYLDRSGEGVTQSELATRCGIDGSTLVRLLDILGEQEFEVDLSTILNTHGPIQCLDLLDGEQRTFPNARVSMKLAACAAHVLQF